MNHEDHDDYPETYSDSIYGEPKTFAPDEQKPSVWLAILVLVFIAAFMFSALGCSQVSESYDEFRETTELSLVGGWRDSTLWGGIRFAKVGRAREIEVIEGEKPFTVNPAK